MTPPTAYAIQARFMFSVLDYSTWNLWVGDDYVAQVTINKTDRVICLCLNSGGADPFRLRELRSVSAWEKFLRTHTEPLL